MKNNVVEKNTLPRHGNIAETHTTIDHLPALLLGPRHERVQGPLHHRLLCGRGQLHTRPRLGRGQLHTRPRLSRGQLHARPRLGRGQLHTRPRLLGGFRLNHPAQL